MMKTSRRVIITCLLTLVGLNCLSAFQQINSINDLKRIYSRKSPPLHSLTLLHWFANNVDIDNNDVVRLSFNPYRDFGSYMYYNNEGLLPSAPEGNSYYTVGDVDRRPDFTCPDYQDFPEYVLYPSVIENSGTGRNRDRILVSASVNGYDGSRIVSQMYLTQKFRRVDNQALTYDPDHTFVITTNLLQELRQFSFNDNSRSLHELRTQFDNNIDNNQLNYLLNLWGRDQAPVGLLYLIVVPQKNNQLAMCESNRRLAPDSELKIPGDWQNCEIQNTHVQVTAGRYGRAKILWRNVPGNQLNNVAAVLFRNQMDSGSGVTYKTIQGSTGSYETNEPLNEGLQVRLHKKQWSGVKEEICRGGEFKSPQSVSVTGYTQLQLFVKNGKACFRLYIKKDCDQWKSDFYYSWVALYTSASKDTSQYSEWQWVINFEQGLASGESDTFESCTDTTVAAGLQARFMIDKGYVEKARTTWI